MRRIAYCLLPTVFATMLTGLAFAQPKPGVDAKADARNGERLAQQWCATCHVVAPGQTRATAAVATFAEIASRPGFNAAQLALFLLNPHPVMPNMGLTRTEAADLASYIATQRK